MKLPFSFSLKFVFRLLFPGFIVTLALFPATRTLLDSLNVNVQSIYVIVIQTIMVGWFFIVLDMHLYMLMEGRRYWPGSLRRVLLSAENKRLLKLKLAYDKAEEAQGTDYVELSVKLRQFPLASDGEFIVKCPTRLGNLLVAYEDYPLRAYGMDAVFYWHRIWLAVDEELREHIDSQQALADSAVYVTIALYVSTLVTAIYVFLQQLPFTVVNYLPTTKTLLFIGVFILILAHIIYRASLWLHAGFGELFKSLFDVHRDKVNIDEVIEKIADLTGDAKIKNSSNAEKYRLAWRYLHNYRISTAAGVVSAAKVSKDN